MMMMFTGASRRRLLLFPQCKHTESKQIATASACARRTCRTNRAQIVFPHDERHVPLTLCTLTEPLVEVRHFDARLRETDTQKCAAARRHRR